MEPEPAELALVPAELAAALGVPIEVTQRQGEALLQFRQPVGYELGLFRRGLLDLGGRQFRSTLWAGPHRCLDHLELDDLRAVSCDPRNGRLRLRNAGLQVVLTRQGTLSVLTLVDGRDQRPLRRRGTPRTDEDDQAGTARGGRQDPRAP